MAKLEIKIAVRRMRDREALDLRVNQLGRDIGAVIEPLFEGKLAEMLDLHTVMPSGYMIVHHTLSAEDLTRMCNERQII